MRTAPELAARLVMTAPGVARLTAPELGALWGLAYAFWEGEGRPLPKDDATLSVLARCHTRRWYEFRESVLAVWRPLEPRLATVYADRLSVTEANLIRSKVGSQASALKRKQRQGQRNADGGNKLIDSESLSARLVPQTRSFAAKSDGNNADCTPKRVVRSQKHALLSDVGT